jgi:hypothetical protein
MYISLCVRGERLVSPAKAGREMREGFANVPSGLEGIHPVPLPHTANVFAFIFVSLGEDCPALPVPPALVVPAALVRLNESKGQQSKENGTGAGENARRREEAKKVKTFLTPILASRCSVALSYPSSPSSSNTSAIVFEKKKARVCTLPPKTALFSKPLESDKVDLYEGESLRTFVKRGASS